MAGSQLDFYRARVYRARTVPAAPPRALGGEGCRRSEAAWSALAERAERSEQRREAELQRKAQVAPQIQE
jgi:hypothetical protein